MGLSLLGVQLGAPVQGNNEVCVGILSPSDMTALHNVALFGSVPVVRLLLEVSADKSLCPDLGLTVRDILYIFGPSSDIEQLLG